MPTYLITSPDGRKFRVTAPAGASKEDVLRYAQQNQPEPIVAPAVEPPEAEDPGALMAGVIGAGRMLDRTYKGVKQAALSVLPGQEAELARMKETEDANTRIYAGLQGKRPIATAVGEIAPLIAALPVAGTMTGAAALGALPGALEYGTGEERMIRGGLGAVGGAVGAGVGKLVGRAIQPIRAPVSETQTAAQEAAKRLGVDLRPGEVTGSRPLRWLETTLNDLPFSAGMGQAAEKARREAINAAGARALGQGAAPEITESVLAAARKETGAVFDNLLAGRRIELGPAFRADVGKIVDSKVMKSLRDDSVEAVLEPFKNMPPGKITVSGEWFQQNKTALDAAIRSAYNTPGQSGRAAALQEFENALVKAATDGMTATEREAFKAAQRQWATLRLLETGKVVEGGNIMPGRLDSALIQRYKAGGAYKEGKITGEIADIGRLGQVYKPLPQSGTAPRGIYSGLAGGAAFLDPMITGSAFAVPPLAQKFLQSNAGRKYLTKGMAEVTPEWEKRLMMGGYGLLGAPYVAGLD